MRVRGEMARSIYMLVFSNKNVNTHHFHSTTIVKTSSVSHTFCAREDLGTTSRALYPRFKGE